MLEKLIESFGSTKAAVVALIVYAQYMLVDAGKLEGHWMALSCTLTAIALFHYRHMEHKVKKGVDDVEEEE